MWPLMICDDGWILGSDVVQELFQSCHCVCHGLCLLQYKCAKSSKNRAVNCSSIPKQFAKDLLKVFCCDLSTGCEATVCVIGCGLSYDMDRVELSKHLRFFSQKGPMERWSLPLS